MERSNGRPGRGALHAAAFAFVVAASLVAIVAAGSAQAQEAAADVEETARRIVERTNALRSANRLQAVATSRELQDAAREFARFMAKSGSYGHEADGRRPEQRATAHGYEHCIVSENIASVHRSTGYAARELADLMFQGWEESAGHRRNMVEPAVTQIGVGIARDDRGRYLGVQMFGRPRSAAIRFSVRNASGQTIAYRTDERRYSLAPRAQRTHTVCVPTAITIDGDASFRDRPQDDVVYTVVRSGSGLAVTRE